MKQLLICLMLVGSAGCANIPTESITLNQSVSANISRLHQNHANAVREFFRLKREAFDGWYMDTYEPSYYSNFESAWNGSRQNAFDISDDTHRLEYVQNSIAEYEELVGQIDDLEMSLLGDLEIVYLSLVQQNDAVTQLLQSAVELNESHKRLWDSTVGSLLPSLEADKIDDAITKIQSGAIAALGG